MKTLYYDDKVHLDVDEKTHGYRLTFFNDENHWNGDITFSKDGKIIFNDLDDEN